MKVVILAGGMGTRLSEETSLRPKPMVEIGERPLLWHIMKIYATYGINDFIICLGYKGYMIKEYFSNYLLHTSDITFDLSQNKTTIHSNNSEPWKITLVETGSTSMTGGRLKRVASYLDDEDFCFTYGDGIADVDIPRLITFHKEQGKQATVTAVQFPSRFGTFKIDENNLALSFEEKSKNKENWINGGFFILSKKVLSLLKDEQSIWEHEPLETLARSGQLSAFKHGGFWHPMDTLRDKVYLEKLWQSGKAPWKTWK